ncbi:DUF4232 domain-containing protein [Streptomyces sp. NPDC050658]|uniref:DUF4232 domain-containing protein n=1 Tax=unclassified Streptomyces TaxID=2593676 RepID=UPI00341FC76F
MTVIPFRSVVGRVRPAVRRAAVVTAVVLLAAGCGLSEELERERDPGRTEAAAPEGGAGASGVPSAPGLPSRTPIPIDEAPAQGAPEASCPASGVRIEPGMVDAAMGLRAMGVTLTNCGKRTYRLNGYPRLRVLDEHREPLDVQILEGPKPVTQMDDPGPHPVTLKRGEAAHTVLVWRNTVTDTTTTAVSGTYLDLTPARGARKVTLTPQGRIDLGNTGRIGTTAWQKSPAGDGGAARPTAPAPSTPAS